jgi:hypothetical protein
VKLCMRNSESMGESDHLTRSPFSWWGPDRHRDALISYPSAGNYFAMLIQAFGPGCFALVKASEI